MFRDLLVPFITKPNVSVSVYYEFGDIFKFKNLPCLLKFSYLLNGICIFYYIAFILFELLHNERIYSKKNVVVAR